MDGETRPDPLGRCGNRSPRPACVGLVVAVGSVLAVAQGAHTALGASRASTCTPVEVRIDTTSADYTAFPFDGRGWGQVVSTMDTVMTSITFWRPAAIDES